MKIKIIKLDKGYKLQEERGSYIFMQPIPIKIKTTILIITKDFPRDTKEQILHNLIVESMREGYIYEKIIEEFEESNNDLYYKEKYKSL